MKTEVFYLMQRYLHRITPLLFCLFSGCFLFASGHLDVRLEAQSDYENGLRLYEGGQFAESEAAFRSLLDQDPRFILARFHLGLSLLKQQRIDDAAGSFRRIMGLGRNLPHGYHGLGLVALERSNRRFEAIDWFRQALRRDPSFVDARWALAQTRLALRNGIFGAFSIGQVRDEVRRVIELDPEHRQAYYALALTYYEYGVNDEAESAIPLLLNQIAVNPGHHDARHQLGLAYIDVDRIADGIAVLEAMPTREPAWDSRIRQVIIEAQLRNALIPADSIFDRLSGLPEREQQLYLDASVVRPEAERQNWSSSTLVDLHAEAIGFWKTQDPTPATRDNPKLVEHYRRIAYSRRFFGRGIWPWDKRGEIYIRYGEPESRRETSSGGSVENETPSALFGMRRVERWVYSTPDLTFDFVDQGSRFAFDAPLATPSGDISSIAEATLNDANLAADHLAEEVPAIYESDIISGPPLRYAYSLAVFRSIDGGAELEMDFGMPLSELTRDEETTTVDGTLTVFDEDWSQISSTDFSDRIALPPGQDNRHSVAFRRQVIRVPAGRHHFALRASESVSGRSGIVRQPVRVPNFATGELALSDIRLSSAVQSEGPKTFERRGRHLMPNPAGVFAVSRPVILYFEVYNLEKSPAGRTSATIEYSVFPLTGETRPVLSGTGDAVSFPTDETQSALFQEEDGTDTDLFRDIAIELSGAEPGRYALRVTVRDLHAGQTIDTSVVVRLVEP